MYLQDWSFFKWEYLWWHTSSPILLAKLFVVEGLWRGKDYYTWDTCKVFWEYGISNTLDVTEDDVLFEESGFSSESDISDDSRGSVTSKTWYCTALWFSKYVWTGAESVHKIFFL